MVALCTQSGRCYIRFMKLIRLLLRAAFLGTVIYRIREMMGEGKPTGKPVQERRAVPDPEALTTRPAGGRVGLNLDRLRSMQSQEYKPLVEYLSYIQVQRGENEQSLVFVRSRDLDSLAALTGGSKDNLVEDFKQLGVLLSMN